MTKRELNQLVEKLISIRDCPFYELFESDREALADACNVIYHNIDKLADKGDA